MWRGQAALTEACRSVGLEDIHVFEGDVIHRHLENRSTDAEAARGTLAVSELLRVIVAPGNLLEDPEHVVARCWRAAVSVHRDGDPDPVPAEIAGAVVAAAGRAPTPTLGALHAAAVFRTHTASMAPSADRLVFMAAEHALRAQKAGQGEIAPDLPEALLRRMRADWILTPSIGLTHGSFRAWSPGRRQGMMDLLDGMSRHLDRAVGSLPLLRRWLAEARAAAAGRHGKSRLRDLVELAARDPILTSGHVRRVLGVSERTSLYLVEQAEEAGILTLITPRRTHRVWAQPQMAELLRQRGVRGGLAAAPSWERTYAAGTKTGVDQAEAGSEAQATPLAEPFSQVDALDELDAAMARADEILGKYADRNSREG